MQWIKKHADSIAVITAIVVATSWMTKSNHKIEYRLNDKILSTENRLNIKINDVDKRINEIDKRLVAIEIIMMNLGYNIKGIVKNEKTKEENK